MCFVASGYHIGQQMQKSPFHHCRRFCCSSTVSPVRFLQQLTIFAHTLQRVFFSLGHLMASPPFYMGSRNKNWEGKQALPDPSLQNVE